MDRRAFLTRRPPAVAPPLAEAPSAALAHAARRADLSPVVGDWTPERTAHLVRRTHLGASRADVVEALTRGGAAAAVDALIAEAQSRPLPGLPRWAGSVTSDGGANVERLYEWQRSWYVELTEGGLRERMALFWHDHFATAQTVYAQASFAVDYLTFLRENAVGPFRPLLTGIGKRPAMLRFLDNDTNVAGDLNENYAREILELFSMGITGPDGQPNYTQNDIVEAARALTGWTVDEDRIRGTFDAARHDAGTKTVLGATGAFDHDGLVNVLFERRPAAIAHFLAGKLYAWFVHPVTNPGVVAALADVLRQSDFDVAAALRALLTSAHFYDPAVVGARLKSPVELALGVLRELEVTPGAAALETIRRRTQSIGQEVLNPPSVEGWPGYDDPLEYRAWVTTGTLPERRGLPEAVIYGEDGFADYDPLPLVASISDRLDPYRIVSDLAAHLLAVPLSDAVRDEIAEQTVLDGVPSSYTREERGGFWADIVISAERVAQERLRHLLSALVNLPEYQLV